MWGSHSITVTNQMISSRSPMIEKKKMLFRVTRTMLLMLLASELSKGKSGMGVEADITEFSNNQQKFLPHFYNGNTLNCKVLSNDNTCQMQTPFSSMLRLNPNKLLTNLKATKGSWHPWNDARFVKKNSQSNSIIKNINNLSPFSKTAPNYPSDLQPPQSLTNRGKNFVSALDRMIPMELMSVLVNCMRKCEVWRARVNYYNCMKLCQHENKILDDMERKDERELENGKKSQNVVQRNSYENKVAYTSDGYSKGDNLGGMKRNCLLEKCLDVKQAPKLAYSTGSGIENLPYSQKDVPIYHLPYTQKDDNQNLPDSKVVSLPYLQQDSSSFLPYTREADMDCDTWPCIGSKVKRDVECLDGECGGGGLVMPRKRRWGDTLTTCIASHCNSLNGVSRVDCIINKCDKQRRG